MTPPSAEALRESPEVATLLSLEAQLALLPIVLASVYGRHEQSASADHARGMARIARILNEQVATYLKMLEVPAAVARAEIKVDVEAPSRPSRASTGRKRV